jgi:hypothetical protein
LADSQVFHGDALTVQHAKNVVVWLHKKGCGIRERLIVCKPACLRVSVGADDGQIADVGIESAGYFELGCFGWKQAIVVEQHGVNITSLRICLALWPALRSDH